MPKNKVIHIGILIVAAAALLWAGGKVIAHIEWFLPWAAGVGIAMVVVGMILEARKPKPADQNVEARR